MPLGNHDLAGALTAWRQQLGDDCVIAGAACQNRYGRSTSGVLRSIPAALQVASHDDIPGILQIARRHHVPLYPISTGRNWGYGTANPAMDDCVILDLSGMNRISSFDAEMGTITVEPGVTQGQLREFLDRQETSYMVPVTGAGPGVSVLGNALERGYGITPYADHFGAVTAIEAVLADGRRYRPALHDLGAETTNTIFKWGVGPYLDGLFTQGNFGIVTRMTLLLAPTPERVTAFFFRLRREQDLEAAVTAIRRTLSDAGAHIGGINLMNAERVLSMVAPWPQDRAPARGALSDELVADMARENSTAPWNGVGAVYSTAGIGKAVTRHIRQQLKPHVQNLVFINPTRLRWARRLLAALPNPATRRLQPLVNTLNSSLDIFSGRPAEVALQLAYWKTPERQPQDRPLDPARDGCGLIWYAPLVPMQAERVRTFVSMVRSICRAHGFEPLMTLTSQSSRCIDATVPLLFRQDDTDETARAQACYEALYRAGQKEGFLPYRMHVQSMHLAITDEAPFWALANRLKQAVDPDNIIAPGRYAGR
ncbi:MAG TPA: FAD-binding oxidoreductase [Salinisphaeraceae bacterium]|nr:FAD-binding oxidoreductase [Salinisphaeraceae bacterium]